MNTVTQEQMQAMCDAWADVCRLDRELMDQGKVVHFRTMQDYQKAVDHYQYVVASARTDIGVQA